MEIILKSPSYAEIAELQRIIRAMTPAGFEANVLDVIFKHPEPLKAIKSAKLREGITDVKIAKVKNFIISDAILKSYTFIAKYGHDAFANAISEPSVHNLQVVK